MALDDYSRTNLAMWEQRAPAHAASRDYAVDRFVEDPGFLSEVVRFDRPRLGDLAGLRGVHLQCHIGTDTISLARLGARMTGLDFSPAALAEARRLSERTGAGVDFVESELYGAVDALGAGGFDLVYTGVGALCWLPDIARWAQVVVDLLRPGGRLFIRECHPVVWSLAYDRDDDLLVLEYPYVEQPEPDLDETEGTYVETDAAFTANRSYSWNHGLGEIVTSLLDRGMRITMFVEHDSVPWNPLDGDTFRPVGEGEYRLADRPWRLPHTYTLQAVKG
jgi:SAM-dependent methyltransferase